MAVSHLKRGLKEIGRVVKVVKTPFENEMKRGTEK